MADIVGSRANESSVRYSADFNSVIGNQSVTALYKLKSGFAFSYSAVAENEHAFAVNLNQNSVARYALSKLNAEI